MQKFLENLRKKDIQDRRSFAFTTSAVVTIIIFLIWLMTFTATLDIGLNNENTKSSPSQNNQANIISNTNN